jgi:hypothetical protein
VVVFVDQMVHIEAATKTITSESLSELFDNRVIRYQRVPQTDGPTEHANGVPEYTLRHFVGPYQSNWDKLLPAVEFVVNNSVHVSTGHTPFMLKHGQHPPAPLTVVLRGMNPHIDRFRGRWSEQLQFARQCLLNAQQRQKAQADTHRRESPNLNPGDNILVHRADCSCARGRAPLLKGGRDVRQSHYSGSLSWMSKH